MNDIIDKLIYALWAKKREDNVGRIFWLPLIQHLWDTKNIAEMLWEKWISPGQKSFIKSSLNGNSDKAKNLITFLALTHDIGKAIPAFQTKRNFYSLELDEIIFENLKREGFFKDGSVNFSNRDKSPHTKSGQYLLHKFGVLDDIAGIVGSHHGKPVDELFEYNDFDFNYLTQESFVENYYINSDEKSENYKIWNSCQKEIFEWALKESGFKSVVELPKIDMPAQVILSGLLIMADWIASTEEYFPLFKLEIGEVPRKIIDRKGYEKWEKNEEWTAKFIENIESAYNNRFGFKARDFQIKFAEIINQVDNPSIFIIEAPMGIGKTEAGLIGVEQLAFKKGCNGMFFGLPTQATSNGIFSRIVSWLNNLGSENSLSLRLAHSKAYLNEEFRSLGDFTNIEIDNKAGEESKISVNQWFSGRKTASLDEFVVGTVDQILMLALKKRHLALRHLGMSKKVVVIDEVHAYDVYMDQYLMRVLEWLGAYDVPVILMSATLPKAKRMELIKSYMSGRGVMVSKLIIDDNEHYPLITYSDGNEVKHFDKFEVLVDKKIKVKKICDKQLVALIKEVFSEGGGVVGIVVNTVKRAQEFGRELVSNFGDECVEILHSGFIATERIWKEKELLSTIGKKGVRPKKKIIIGTQVIEQSLDIDFDVLISDLAPMDFLLQRCGRLHRHNTARPKKLLNPTLYVMGCSDTLDFERGASAIYGNYLLQRTQYFLPDNINIPTDISTLVQKVYDDKSIEIDKKFKEKFNNFEEEYRKKIKQKERKAKQYRLSEPITAKEGRRNMNNGNLIGWLKNSIPKDTEERAYAQVRDIDESIEVIALKRIGDGYGLMNDKINISKEIDDDNIARKIAANTLVLPKIFTGESAIDKTIDQLENYNSKYLNDWRENKWLNGALGIIFEENFDGTEKFTFNFLDKTIVYDEKYGISFKNDIKDNGKEIGNGKI